METHQPDPTSQGERDPWEEVRDQVGELGERLKETYRRTTDGKGPSEDEIRQAFVTLAGAWDQVASSLSGVLKDEELRVRLRATAVSLAEALGDTLAGVGDELQQDAEEE